MIVLGLEAQNRSGPPTCVPDFDGVEPSKVTADVPPLRLYVDGGSYTDGLGCFDRPSYGRQVAERLGADLLHLAASSQVSSDIVGHRDQVEAFAPDIAVLEIGGTDAMVFPGAGVQKLLERVAPPGWHGVAGLEARAAFSRTPEKRRRQEREQTAKLLVKRVLITLTRGRSRFPREVREGNAVAHLTWLSQRGTRVYVVGYPTVSATFFPGTPRQLALMSDCLRRTAAGLPGVTYLDPEPWSDARYFLPDTMHLNGGGHDRVADLVVAAVSRDLGLTAAGAATPSAGES